MVGRAHFWGCLCADCTLDVPLSADSLPGMNTPFTAPESREDVERHLRENDVEFLFAQFVDMHGKPSAKLVPARHLDGLLSDGAGFAGPFPGGGGGGPPPPRGFGPRQKVRGRAVGPLLPLDVTVAGEARHG